MPTKDVVKEIYLAVRNEDGTYGKPMMILKPMKEKDLYADDEGLIDKENRKFYEGGEWKRERERMLID
ncbi:hypothetical protein [Bacillus wiedmannii]|uniref:hypothetical protein n=1 Tax=Bacillus wiedmannii TaxID=1890302 RepID=UPI0021D3AC6F|nr:hypothetical protein [Bacillus wiedmannii]MCU5095040.1 hypothetical protein [Bacillus wiedmannii]